MRSAIFERCPCPYPVLLRLPDNGGGGVGHPSHDAQSLIVSSCRLFLLLSTRAVERCLQEVDHIGVLPVEPVHAILHSWICAVVGRLGVDVKHVNSAGSKGRSPPEYEYSIGILVPDEKARLEDRFKAIVVPGNAFRGERVVWRLAFSLIHDPCQMPYSSGFLAPVIVKSIPASEGTCWCPVC